MDLGTIKSRLEGLAQPSYKTPEEFLRDCRLVFDNARKYNPPGSDIHVMAQTLADKLEEKWAPIKIKVWILCWMLRPIAVSSEISAAFALIPIVIVCQSNYDN